MAEIWRAELLESLHLGHAVICDDTGQIVRAWGDPDAVIYPRSSAKMIQALPLLRSGAADAVGLTSHHLALACASHDAAAIHTDRVRAWLKDLDLTDDAFRCGPQNPGNEEAHHDLIRRYETPCQYHNECSGKHSGFLTLNKHLGAGPDYVDPGHPVQRACLEMFEDSTGQTSTGYGIDGCSAPNFQTTVHGLARAMANFASAPEGSAEARLRQAMMLHPELVAGEGKACTELMRAMGGKAAAKTGAEGVFVAIIPELKQGVAVKISDGTARAKECAIAAILVGLGVLDANHPATLKWMNAPILNRRGLEVGKIRPAAELI
jgi:L-asparaginase II